MPIPGAVTASMGKRLLAVVIDAVAALVLGGGFVTAGMVPLLRTAQEPGSVPTGVPVLVLVGWVALLVVGVIQWWLLGTRGWTLGKRLVGLRVVAVRGGRPVGLARALLRLVVQGASGIVPVVGPVLMGISPLFDGSGRRQGWHDKAAGSLVLDVAVGRDPALAQASVDPNRRIDALLRSPGGPALVGAVPGGRPTGPPPPPAPAPAPAGPPPPAPVPAPAPPGPVEHVPGAPDPSRRSGPAPGLVAGPPAAGAVAEPEVDDVGTTAPFGVIASVPSVGRAAQAATPPAGTGAGPDAVPTGPGRAAGDHEDPAAPDDVEMTRLRPARGRVPELVGGTLAVTLALTDGRRVSVSGTALVGRNPAPRAGEEVAQLIQVPDPGRSVSKTHLAVGVDRTGVWVRDRDSTNGTVVTLADGQQILCGANQQVRLPPGASVAFGDYGFTVVPPAD